MLSSSLLRSPILKALLPILIMFGVLRLTFWFNTFPNPDEAYYWLWGQHPDFSYYDHPPFHAWVQGLMTSLLGQSFVALRSSNLLSNGILFYTYYQITHYLYGKQGHHYFWLTIALLLASPLYFLFLALAWHDHWLITFSLIAAFQFVQFLDSYTPDGQGQTQRLYGAAIALGFALLCKYNAVFSGCGCLVAILGNPQWRPLLRDRRLYIAMLITLSLLLPIVIWNFNNDFQSFRYYGDRSVDNSGFRLKFGETLGFLGISILMVSPINSWAIVRVLRSPRHSTYQIVAFWIFTVSTLSLTAISLVSTAYYYWNILAYLLVFPLLPTVFKSSDLTEGTGQQPSTLSGSADSPEATQPTSKSPKPLLSKPFLAGQCYGLLFALLLVVHYSVIPLSAFSAPESDPDSRLLFGWEQVGVAVQAQSQTLNNPFFVTTDYRSAAALAYQLNDPNVLAISDRIDQFDFWIDVNQLKGRDAVILTDDWHPLKSQLQTQFEQVSTPQKLTVKRFGVFIKNYYVLRGYSFRLG